MTEGGAAIVTNMAVVRSILRYFVSVFGKGQRVLKSVTRVVLFALCLKTLASMLYVYQLFLYPNL
jgi:hypothetical protein